MRKESFEMMAYKWRPKLFEDIIGQNNIVEALKNSLKNKTIANAYLFCGPRGTGKTSVARIFAKKLNCRNKDNDHIEKTCLICNGINIGTFIDCIEIDGASNNSVEQIRDIKENCQYIPVVGIYKIYIIDEVHMLSKAAFNALLKVLEEPPRHVKFILATTEIQKIPLTVLSRCQIFKFDALSDKIIYNQLLKIIKKDNIQIEQEAINILSRLSEGSMRDAQMMLDQAIAFADEKKITEIMLSKFYRIISTIEIKNIYHAIINSNYHLLLSTIKSLIHNKCNLLNAFIQIKKYFLIHFNDILIKNENCDLINNNINIINVLLEGETILQNKLSQNINFETLLLKIALIYEKK